MAHLYDSNIFIRSKNDMPLDLWPTFWHRMTEMICGGQVFISVKVKEEIEHGNDELVTWLKDSAPKSCFVELDESVMTKFQEVISWAMSRPFTQAAQNTFAQVADSYLVATAAAKGMIVVSYEHSNPQSKRRVLIPDACNAMGVACCDLNTVLRSLGITI
jgi:hypothetical protein